MNSENGKCSSKLSGSHHPDAPPFAGLPNGNAKEPYACPVNLDEERDANVSARSNDAITAILEGRDDIFTNTGATPRLNLPLRPSAGMFRATQSYAAQTRQGEELSFPSVVDTRKPTPHSNLVGIPNPSINTNGGMSPSLSTLLQSRQHNPSVSETSTLQQEASRRNSDYVAKFATQTGNTVPTPRPKTINHRRIVNTPLGLAVLLNYDGFKPIRTPIPLRALRRTPNFQPIQQPQPMRQPQTDVVVSNYVQVGTQEVRKFQRWSHEEDVILKNAVESEGGPPINWQRMASKYFCNVRTALQCKSRWTKSLKPGILKGAWTPEEDACILRYKQEGLKLSEIAQYLPGRIAEHVSDRYNNALDPELKKTPWTKAEDRILFQEQRRFGNKWTKISQLIPGRSENSVKNRWHNLKATRQRRERAGAAQVHKRQVRIGSRGMKDNNVGQEESREIKLRLLLSQITQELSIPKTGSNEAAMVLERKRLEEQIQSLQLGTTQNPPVLKSEPEVIEIDDD